MLFGVYYTAPVLLRASHARPGDSDASRDPADCHGNPDPLIRKVSVVLHVLAFASGVTAACLGVSLGA